MTPGILPDAGARRSIFALGGVYAVISAVWPFVRIAGHTSLRESLIVSTLVGGAGIALLYGGYRLPRSEIRPRFFATVASWCFRAAGVMVGILVFIALVSDLNDPAANFLILPALAAVAGLVGGIHDARAKTRAAVLEQRNRELQQTQVQLEETIERLEESERRYRTVTENFPNGAVGLLNEEL